MTQEMYLLKLQSAFLVISNHKSFRVLFDKVAPVYFILKKCIFTLALEMPGPAGNQHSANLSTHFN